MTTHISLPMIKLCLLVVLAVVALVACFTLLELKPGYEKMTQCSKDGWTQPPEEYRWYADGEGDRCRTVYCYSEAAVAYRVIEENPRRYVAVYAAPDRSKVCIRRIVRQREKEKRGLR